MALLCAGLVPVALCGGEHAGADAPSSSLAHVVSEQPALDESSDGPGDPDLDDLTLFKRYAHVLALADVDTAYTARGITDIEIADLNGDLRPDLAVAWYATDYTDPARNIRMLSILVGDGADSFTPAVDIDLYVLDPFILERSIFRHGTAEIAKGDFDGDGDTDLAVTPFFGDEIWFIENLGEGTFDQHVKFAFGINGTGNFQASPEAASADFNLDGRDDVVSIADPIQFYNGAMLHFWTTDNTIANMHRVSWAGDGGEEIQWLRGLAIADFDLDGRPDICITGSVHPSYEDDPGLAFWYDLDPQSGEFEVQMEYPRFLGSDVVAVQPLSSCPPGVIVASLDGDEIEYWASDCDGDVSFHRVGGDDGYAGLAPGRGMVAVTADIDGDGDQDLITRQRGGTKQQRNQIEFTISRSSGGAWSRLPIIVDTGGLKESTSNSILRPRNLAAADLFGNSLPEVVAAFDPLSYHTGRTSVIRFSIVYWANSCVGDATRDGLTDIDDVTYVISAINLGLAGSINPNADLNKDGVIDQADLGIVLEDYGCVYSDDD